MWLERKKLRSGLINFYLVIFSAVMSVGVLFIYFYIGDLARNDPEFASSNAITLKIGRTGYLYSHASVQYACGRYDPDLAYVMKPGECTQDETEYQLHMDINSAGLRDDEESLDDSDIIVLGDSHAMGLGVAQDRIFAAVLERTSGLKVLNAGVSSYGTVREMMLLRRLGANRAKYVVLQYCRNDIDENMAFYENGGRLDIMSMEKYQELAKLDIGNHRTFFGPGMGLATRAYEKVVETLNSLFNDSERQITEADIFKFVISRNMDILQDKKIILLDINGHNKYDNNFIRNAKNALADLKLDVDFIDLGRVLEDDDFFVLDNHMKSSGHQKVAEAILQALRQDASMGSTAARR